MGSAYANFSEDKRGMTTCLAGRSASSQTDDQPVRRPLIASSSIDLCRHPLGMDDMGRHIALH